MKQTITTTGDQVIDKLITEYSNAVFECGDFREVGEDPCYDEDRKFQTYDECNALAITALEALYAALANRFASEAQAMISRD